MTAHLDLIYAEKLRRLRNEKNDKQEAIAIDLGISQRDYSDLENGRIHFSDDMIRKICLVFHLSPATFKKIEVSAALGDFLKVLTEAGVVKDGKEIVARDLEILIYKKTIKELQYEKEKLVWEMKKSKAQTDRFWSDTSTGIYVII